MGLLWYCCGNDVGFLWDVATVVEFPVVLLGIAVVLLWHDCGIPVIAGWIACCGVALVLLCFLCGIPVIAMRLLWGEL